MEKLQLSRLLSTPVARKETIKFNRSPLEKDFYPTYDVSTLNPGDDSETESDYRIILTTVENDINADPQSLFSISVHDTKVTNPPFQGVHSFQSWRMSEHELVLVETRRDYEGSLKKVKKILGNGDLWCHLVIQSGMVKRILVVNSTHAVTYDGKPDPIRHAVVKLISTMVVGYRRGLHFWEKSDIGESSKRLWLLRKMLPRERSNRYLLVGLKQSLKQLEGGLYEIATNHLNKSNNDDQSRLFTDLLTLLLKYGRKLNRLVKLEDSLVPMSHWEVTNKRYIGLLDSLNERDYESKVYLDQDERGSTYYYQPSEYDLFFNGDEGEKEFTQTMLDGIMSIPQAVNDPLTHPIDIDILNNGRVFEDIRKETYSDVLATLRGEMITLGTESFDKIWVMMEQYPIDGLLKHWSGRDGDKLQGEEREKLEAFQAYTEVTLMECVLGLYTLCYKFLMGLGDQNQPSDTWSARKQNTMITGMWYSLIYHMKTTLIADPKKLSIDPLLEEMVATKIGKNDAGNSFLRYIWGQEIEGIFTYFERFTAIIQLDIYGLDIEAPMKEILTTIGYNLRRKPNLYSTVERGLVALDGLITLDTPEDAKKQIIHRNGSLLIKACKITPSTEGVDYDIGERNSYTHGELHDLVNDTDWAPHVLTVPKVVSEKMSAMQEPKYSLPVGDYFVNEPSEFILFKGKSVDGTRLDYYENAAKEVITHGYIEEIGVKPFPLSRSVVHVTYQDLRDRIEPIIGAEIKRVRRMVVTSFDPLKKAFDKSKATGVPISLADFNYHVDMDAAKKHKRVSVNAKLQKYLKKLLYFRMLLSAAVDGGGRDASWKLEWHKGTEYKGSKSYVCTDDLNLMFYRASEELKDDEYNRLMNVGEYSAWLVDVQDLKTPAPLMNESSSWDTLSTKLGKYGQNMINDKIDTKEIEGEKELKVKNLGSDYQRVLGGEANRIDSKPLFISHEFRCPTIAKIAVLNFRSDELYNYKSGGGGGGVTSGDYFKEMNEITTEVYVDLMSDLEEGEEVANVPIKTKGGWGGDKYMYVEDTFASTELRDAISVKTVKKNLVTNNYVVGESFLRDSMGYGTEVNPRKYSFTESNPHVRSNRVLAEAWMHSPYLWLFKHTGAKEVFKSIYKPSSLVFKDSLEAILPEEEVNLDNVDPFLKQCIKNHIKAVLSNYDIRNKDEKDLRQKTIHRVARGKIAQKMMEANHKASINGNDPIVIEDMTRVIGRHFHRVNNIWAMLYLINEDEKTSDGAGDVLGSHLTTYAPLAGDEGNRRNRLSSKLRRQIRSYLAFIKQLVSFHKNDITYPWVASVTYDNLLNNVGQKTSPFVSGFILKHQVNMKPPPSPPTVNGLDEGLGKNWAFAEDYLEIFYGKISKDWVKAVLVSTEVVSPGSDGRGFKPPLSNVLAVLKEYCLQQIKEVSKTNTGDINDPHYIPKELLLHLPASKKDKSSERKIKQAFTDQPTSIKYVDVLYYDFMSKLTTEGGDFRPYGEGLFDDTSMEAFDALVSEYALSSSICLYEITKASENYLVNVNHKDSVLKQKIQLDEDFSGHVDRTVVQLVKNSEFDLVYHKKKMVANIYLQALRLVKDMQSLLSRLFQNTTLRVKLAEEIDLRPTSRVRIMLENQRLWKQEDRAIPYGGKMKLQDVLKALDGLDYYRNSELPSDVISFIVDMELRSCNVDQLLELLLDNFDNAYGALAKKSPGFPPDSSYFLNLLQAALHPGHVPIGRKDRPKLLYGDACKVLDAILSNGATNNASGDELYTMGKRYHKVDLSFQDVGQGLHRRIHDLFRTRYLKWLENEAAFLTGKGDGYGALDDYFPNFAYMAAEVEAILFEHPSIRQSIHDVLGNGPRMDPPIRLEKIQRDPIYKTIFYQYYYLMRDYYKLLLHYKREEKTVAKFNEKYKKIRDLYVTKWSLALQRIKSQ